MTITITIDRAARAERSRAMNLQFGTVIDQRLRARGASLHALSRATRIPYSTLYGKVRRGNRITLPDLCRIAVALDTEPSELLPEIAR
jgi:lambda repressor-like predicted transcriptional regulator